MNENKSIPPIFIGIALIGLGAFTGYAVSQVAEKATVDQKVSEIIQGRAFVPSSKLFSGWVNNVIGNVAEITPTSITVEKDGEKLSISIVKSTKIERRAVDANGVLVDSPEPASLSDIKNGDSIFVGISVNDDGDVIAERIFVLPPPPVTPPLPNESQ
ncbi:MAG: hypothetical protein Q7R48_02085 [bacterium]|nr:hypothetical protein [bacterium]